MTLPVEARRAMGMEGQTTSVLIVGQPGRVILTPAPLAEDLLAFASERAAERTAELAPDDESTQGMGESSA